MSDYRSDLINDTSDDDNDPDCIHPDEICTDESCRCWCTHCLIGDE